MSTEPHEPPAGLLQGGSDYQRSGLPKRRTVSTTVLRGWRRAWRSVMNWPVRASRATWTKIGLKRRIRDPFPL